MRYLSFLVTIYLLIYGPSIVAKETTLHISAERIGFDKKIVMQELKNAIRSMKTQDKFVVTEMINFLYAKEAQTIHTIGLRGTLFLLCKTERLLRYYENYFVDKTIFNKLLNDIEQKKEELDRYQE